MADFEAEISGFLRQERINVPDHFADNVMDRIAVERAGGLKALSSASRALIFAVLIIVYSSLGILLGIQSYKNFAPDSSADKEKILTQFRDVYHLNPVEMYDRIFRPFTSEN